MKSLADLKSFASHLRLPHYGNRIRPARDWLVLLLVSGVVLGVSVGWNISFFLAVISNEPLPTDENVVIPDRKPRVDAVLEAFSLREAEETKVRSEYQFVDPSR